MKTELVLLCSLWLPFGASDDPAPRVSRFEHAIELDSDRVATLDTSSGALVRGVTIHSAIAPAFVGDVLVVDGDIAAIGRDLRAPEG